MSAHDEMTDDLWAAPRPLLPPEPPKPKGSTRACRIARRCSTWQRGMSARIARKGVEGKGQSGR